MNITIRTQGLPDGSHPEKAYVFWVDTETGVVEIPWDDDPDHGSGYGKEIEQDSWLRRLTSPKLRVSVFGHFELEGGGAQVARLLTLLRPVAVGGMDDGWMVEGENDGLEGQAEPGKTGPGRG